MPLDGGSWSYLRECNDATPLDSWWSAASLLSPSRGPVVQAPNVEPRERNRSALRLEAVDIGGRLLNLASTKPSRRHLAQGE